MSKGSQASPSILMIVGITGDLAKRKLLTALFHLEKDTLLPEKFYIVGSTRQDKTSEQYRDELKKEWQIHTPIGERFLKRIHIVKADLTKDEGLDSLNDRLDAIEDESGMCLQRLFYLAVPPTAYENVVASLGSGKVHECSGGKKGSLLIEKPFGQNLETAKSLSAVINRYFAEENVFRIDHYLAKETVQNLLSFRFRNPLVHDIWNSKFINHIQISALEELSVEKRASFYEQTGALRDLVQSHLLQLLALTTMKSPASMSSEDVRAERLKLLKAVKPAAIAARGQYKGYTTDVGNADSFVETFAAVQIEIDNGRWRGVPIYIRTGKSMAQKRTEISLIYNDPSIENCPDNLLTFRIQPNEGIALNLQAKKPGLANETQDIVMDYCYARSNDDITHDAYEKLLMDAIAGDQRLFPSTEEVLESWRVVDDIVEKWTDNGEGLEMYEPGAWSTDGSRAILAENNHQWLAQEAEVCEPEKPEKQ